MWVDDENSLGCRFCERIDRGDFDSEEQDCVTLAPRNPVTVGHVLVVPRAHIRDVTQQPHISAVMMRVACEVAGRYAHEEWEQPNVHIITNIGPHAGQRVWHAHLHVIPRSPGDGLSPILGHHDDHEVTLT
jgi:histidine triad (HIT) family protein